MPTRGRAERTKILVIDDHPIVRQGLRQMLSQESDLEVCGDVGTIKEALAAVEELQPNLAIVDLALGGSDGLELVKQISARWPSVFLLVLSMHSETLYAERSLRAGAHGYLMKQEPPELVLEAIRKIREGSVFVSEELQGKWVRRVVSGKRSELTPMESLTDRELAVFQLIGEGLSTKAVAHKLNLSTKTIETYRENIKSKLDLGSATELIQQATLWLRSSSEH